MPHCIDTSTGRAACLTTGTPPWHGLGVTVKDATNSKRAIQLAGLDFTVAPWSLDAIDPQANRGRAAVDGHVANVRLDTRAVLGVVSNRYRIVQNVEAFDFVDALAHEGLVTYETAGALHGGKRVWMLARMPKTLRIVGDDVVRPYVLLTNSHDGNSALRMLCTTVRVVCQNTLNLALTGAKKREGFAFAHRGDLDARIDEARTRLGILEETAERFEDEARELCKVQVNANRLDAYFDRIPDLLPTPNPAASDELTDRQRATRRRGLDRLHANFEDASNDLPGVRGTAWAAYNSVSALVDHPSWSTTTSAWNTPVAKADRRLSSAWFGHGHRIKQTAFAKAKELASLN